MLSGNAALGVPYTKEMIASAAAQADPGSGGAEAVMARRLGAMAPAAHRARRWPEPPSARSAVTPALACGRYAPDANKSGFIAEYHEKVIKEGKKIIWKSLFLLNVWLFCAPGPAAALRGIRCTCRLRPRAVWRGQGDGAYAYEGFFLGLT